MDNLEAFLAHHDGIMAYNAPPASICSGRSLKTSHSNGQNCAAASLSPSWEHIELPPLAAAALVEEQTLLL